jgi:hypothetical protein
VTLSDVGSVLFGPAADVVIAGFDPAIHSVTAAHVTRGYGMDARIKSGHDDGWRGAGVVKTAERPGFHPLEALA